MLNIYKTDDNLVCVEEHIQGFNSTKSTYWYYDLENKKMSSHGRKGDKPDRRMTQADLDWYYKYHHPKLQS